MGLIRRFLGAVHLHFPSRSREVRARIIADCCSGYYVELNADGKSQILRAAKQPIKFKSLSAAKERSLKLGALHVELVHRVAHDEAGVQADSGFSSLTLVQRSASEA